MSVLIKDLCCNVLINEHHLRSSSTMIKVALSGLTFAKLDGVFAIKLTVSSPSARSSGLIATLKIIWSLGIDPEGKVSL